MSDHDVRPSRLSVPGQGQRGSLRLMSPDTRRPGPEPISALPAMHRFTTDAARWDAVLQRNRQADGLFVYAVRSTGIYCRPTCPSRRPRRDNATFHQDGAAARAAGYRPCRRCDPDGASRAERDAAIVARACRLIEASDEAPSLDRIAAGAGLSRFHFHRLFRDVVGMTPAQYVRARRAARARVALPAGRSVTTALFDAGFGSSATFYSDAAGAFGMTPGRYRDGGRGSRIRYALGRCSLGAVLVAATEQGVAAIELGEPDEGARMIAALQVRFPHAELVADDPVFAGIVAEVVDLVERPAGARALPLDLQGTAFQHRVWNALRSIAPGRTASYREIAARIGMPTAVRAVAGACAANPVAVAVPCHRVVRSDGSLSGYRWGVQRKQELLAREAAASADPPGRR